MHNLILIVTFFSAFISIDSHLWFNLWLILLTKWFHLYDFFLSRSPKKRIKT